MEKANDPSSYHNNKIKLICRYLNYIKMYGSPSLSGFPHPSGLVQCSSGSVWMAEEYATTVKNNMRAAERRRHSSAIV